MEIRFWGHVVGLIWGCVLMLLAREKARLESPYDFNYLFLAACGFVIVLSVIVNSIALEVNLRQEHSWSAFKKSFAFANAAALVLGIIIVAVIQYAL